MIAFWIQIPDPWRHHPGFPWQYYSFWNSFLPNFRRGNLENHLSWWRSTDWVPFYLEWFPLLLLGRNFWEEVCRHELGIVLVFMYLKHLKKFPNLFGACRVLQISPARKGEGLYHMMHTPCEWEGSYAYSTSALFYWRNFNIKIRYWSDFGGCQSSKVRKRIK